MLTGLGQAGQATKGQARRLTLRRLWNSRHTTEHPNTAEEPFHRVVRESFYKCKSDNACPYLHTLNGSQCPSERTPNLYPCLPGLLSSAPAPLSPYYRLQTQLCSYTGPGSFEDLHTCHSLCLEHSSHLTTSFTLQVRPTFLSKLDPLSVFLS